MEGTEETVYNLETKIKNSLTPKLTGIEAKLMLMQANLKRFHSSNGEELLH